MSTYEIKDPAARAAYEAWVATRRHFDRLEDHAAGSSEGPGWGYDPGWIAEIDVGWYTVASNHDHCTADSLEDAEAWLWNNYASHEVLP